MINPSRELPTSLDRFDTILSKGKIVWDYDHELHGQTGLYKLCVTDNGVGMSGPEMQKYINSLSSSGGTQGFDKNFGIGAKIAAATRNKRGIAYQSWKEGEQIGQSAVLWKDPVSEKYGLKPLKGGMSSTRYVIPAKKAPEIIQDMGHGTK